MIREDKGEDIFIPHRALNGAMHGDTVLAIKLGEEGAVVSVVKRGITSLAGTYEAYGKKDLSYPTMRIILKISLFRLIKTWAPNRAARSWLTYWTAERGEVVKILGRAGERQADILSILLNYGFNGNFFAPKR